jgi:hypothetical protein
MDIKKEDIITHNKELMDLIENSPFKDSKEIKDLVSYGLDVSNLELVNSNNLDRLSKNYKDSTVIEDILNVNEEFKLSIEHNSKLAVAKLLAQYSVKLEYDRLKDIIDITNKLPESESEVINTNINYINSYTMFVDSINDSVRHSDDLNVLNSIATLNSKFSIKESSDSLERPLSLETIDNLMKVSKEIITVQEKEVAFVDPSIKGKNINFSDIGM